MNIQQLIEKVHMYNESISEFKLTNLQYTITYNSGKIFESTINVVDSLHYNLYDLILLKLLINHLCLNSLI